MQQPHCVYYSISDVILQEKKRVTLRIKLYVLIFHLKAIQYDLIVADLTFIRIYGIIAAEMYHLHWQNVTLTKLKKYSILFWTG